MTIDEIKELIRVVHETGIAELEVQRGEDRVRIRSSIGPVNQDIVIHFRATPDAGDSLVPAIRRRPSRDFPSAGRRPLRQRTTAISW